MSATEAEGVDAVMQSRSSARAGSRGGGSFESEMVEGEMLAIGVGGEGLRLASRFELNFEVKLDALLGRDLLSQSGMDPSDHFGFKIFSPIKGAGVAATAAGGPEGRQPLAG
jgi:hypothetical protein